MIDRLRALRADPRVQLYTDIVVLTIALFVVGLLIAPPAPIAATVATVSCNPPGMCSP